MEIEKKLRKRARANFIIADVDVLCLVELDNDGDKIGKGKKEGEKRDKLRKGSLGNCGEGAINKRGYKSC